MEFIQQEDTTYEQYIEHMEEGGVWGDDVEIQAISELYCKNIQVLQDTKTGFKIRKTFHEEYAGDGEPLRLVRSL